jgi:aminoglycoside N3'-acetyltransferase
MELAEVRHNLGEMLAGDYRPVAIFSALWPLMRATRMPGEQLCNDLLEIVADLARERIVMMPTFPPEPIDGMCNLDSAPSTTGELSEGFRTQSGTRRTICAFFPFSVRGPGADEVIFSPPIEAWGEGSLYHWMYDRDVHIVTIGVHPTHCSFSHFAEWLARDIIPYRYQKQFSIEFIHEERSFHHEQTLLVKQRTPRAVNDFTWLFDEYMGAGMKHKQVEGIHISEIGAKNKIDVILPHIRKDPLALLKNKHEFRGNDNR